MQKPLQRSLIRRCLIPCSALLLSFGVSLPLLARPVDQTLIPRNVALIANSGSVNTIGYRIIVSPEGNVSFVDGKGSGHGTLPKKFTRHFFHDLAQAHPLDQLPEKTPCLKSYTTGTITEIQFNGEHSPDISCPGNDKASDLEEDVRTITRFFHIKNVLNDKGTPIPPQNFIAR
ncbi:hypothetical protein [Tengunoibacter tsumagoiensis]|uniref:Uncharacterized protein n=1 Tax=Tengunoibacter tsumagoiensis TaxID=2014871 RepID=A0A401ZXQ7_9CHLR|nr:hypothetical protein [Tengunoibacter tsumagoiensis]GCE11648.1 hypothetical protein KTT_15070 [Tengunoibacter tsumagoiensis]